MMVNIYFCTVCVTAYSYKEKDPRMSEFGLCVFTFMWTNIIKRETKEKDLFSWNVSTRSLRVNCFF